MFDNLTIAAKIRKIISVFWFLRNTQGRIFSVTFITTDGRTRTLNCKVLRSPLLIRGAYPVFENNLYHKIPIDYIRSFRALNVLKMKCGRSSLDFSSVA